MRRVGAGWKAFVAVAAGLVVGFTVTAIITTAAHGRAETFVSGAHLPPLLTLRGEDVVLRYAILCPPADGNLAPGEPCDGGGDAYIRAGHSGAFRKLTLARGADSAHGRYSVRVPDAIATSPTGFSYYAVLRDEASGSTTTLPAAGAAAPQNSYQLIGARVIDLGVHRFGETRSADARVVTAPWGVRVGDVGLGGGVTDDRIGPSAFDVTADGTVTLLDELNGRIERFRDGRASATPIAVPPVLDDMAIAPDGTIYVADGRSDVGETPLLRTFDAGGTLRSAEHLAERTWSQLRVGPSGAVVQQQPSEQWMPPGRADDGFAGRPLADGSRLIVLHAGAGEVRIARIAGGVVRESWRIVSDTPLGEVQLAEHARDRLVLVVKAYTETRDEFEVITVDRNGVRRFSVPSAQWTETAPLARFRFDGRSVYQLGSTPDGVFVDRFDLGGDR